MMEEVEIWDMAAACFEKDLVTMRRARALAHKEEEARQKVLAFIW